MGDIIQMFVMSLVLLGHSYVQAILLARVMLVSFFRRSRRSRRCASDGYGERCGLFGNSQEGSCQPEGLNFSNAWQRTTGRCLA